LRHRLPIAQRALLLWRVLRRLLVEERQELQAKSRTSDLPRSSATAFHAPRFVPRLPVRDLPLAPVLPDFPALSPATFLSLFLLTERRGQAPRRLRSLGCRGR